MGLRIVCQVLAEESKISFTWFEGAGSFAPYAITGFPLQNFCRKASEARKCLGELVDIYNTQNRHEEWQCLLQLAQLGHALYQEIFRTPTSREVEAWLNQARDLNEVESFEIVLHAETEEARKNLNIPWNIVYGTAPDEQDFTQNSHSKPLDHFWGRAYNLACGLRVDPLRRRPWLENRHVLFVIDAEVESSMGQMDKTAQESLREFIKSRRITVASKRVQFEQELHKQRPDVVYWFSHATPDELYLGDDRLTAFDLYQIFDSLDKSRYGGFVFLNACQTLQKASTERAYLSAVTQCGMSGIVGTEHETIDVYANQLGLEFLEKFLDGQGTVAKIMTDLRRKDPLGLLYATYCPPHIRVSQPKPPLSIDQPLTNQLITASETELKKERVGNLLGGVATTVAVLRPLPRPPAYPYMALAAYDRSRRALFAGRRNDCDHFTAILNAPATKILALQGASGVGKTSFLRAEVIPFLEEENIGYRFLRNRRRDDPEQFPKNDDIDGGSGILFVRAGKDLVAELSQAIWDFAAAPYPLLRPNQKRSELDLLEIVNSEAEASVQSAEELTSFVRSDPGLLHRILCALSAVLPFAILLIVDQAEEIFTQSQGPEALAVLSKIAENAEGDYKLILSLRTEYYGRLISALRKGRPRSDTIREYLLTDFSEDDLADAIERPTANHSLPYTSDIPFEVYQFSYKPRLARKIAVQIREFAAKSQDSILPLAQVICTQLYDLVNARQGEARVISEEDLTAIGGVSGGMVRHVNSLIEKLFSNGRDRNALKHLMTRLVLEQSDGTLTTAIVGESVLSSRWRGKSSFSRALDVAAKPDYRLLKRGQLRDNDANRTDYVSLGHDALAKVAQVWKKEEEAKERTKNVVLAVLAGSLVLVGLLYLWLKARNASYLNNVERAANRAQVVYEIEPDVAMLVAAEATKLIDNSETRSAIMSVLEREPRLQALLPGHSDGVLRIAFSHDGTIIVTLDGSGTIRFWDPKGHYEKYPEIHLGPKQDTLALAILSDNTRLAVAFRSGLVHFWNIQSSSSSGACQFEKPPVLSKDDFPGTKPGRWRVAAFSPDGRRLAYGGEESKIKLWQVPECKQEQPLDIPSNSREIQFSPNGELLGIGYHNGVVSAIDLTTRKSVGILPALPDAFKNLDIVTALAFSQDSKRIAAAYFSGKLQTAELGKKSQVFTGPNSSISAVTFSPKSDSLAVGTTWRGQINLQDLRNDLHLQPLLAHASGISVLRSSPDGNTFASGSSTDTFAALWNLSATCRICSELPGISSASSAVFRPNGQLILSTFTSSGDSTHSAEIEDPKIQIWTGSELSSLVPGLGAKRMSISQNGNILAFLSDQIHVLNLRSGLQPKPVPSSRTSIIALSQIALSTDGKMLAASVEENNKSVIKAWNVDNLDTRPKQILGNFSQITALRFKPDNRVMLVAEKEGTVTFWNTSTWSEAFSPFKGHVSFHGWKGAAFSNDGTVYAEGEANQIRLWNLRDGKQIGLPLVQAGPSFTFAFTKDDRTLASGSYSGTIQLWDVGTQQPLGPALHASSGISYLEFSPDSKSLVSIAEGKIFTWTLTPDKWREVAEHVVRRNLSCNEWKQYFGSERYRKTFDDLTAPSECK